LKGRLPFPRADLSYGRCDGYAKNCVAIERRDPGLELSNVSVEVSGHDAMAKEFEQFIFVAARLWR
jgi:hypothetical protein